MVNALDDQLMLMNNASVGVKTLGDTHGATSDQIAAQGNMESQKALQDLIAKQNQELSQPDPSSTIGQPGEKIIIGPPRDILVMPRTDSQQTPCFSESWWTRQLAPIPRFEKHYDRVLPTPPMGLSERDTKYPPTVADFPIHPDRHLEYRAFLS